MFLGFPPFPPKLVTEAGDCVWSGNTLQSAAAATPTPASSINQYSTTFSVLNTLFIRIEAPGAKTKS